MSNSPHHGGPISYCLVTNHLAKQHGCSDSERTGRPPDSSMDSALAALAIHHTLAGEALDFPIPRLWHLASRLHEHATQVLTLRQRTTPCGDSSTGSVPHIIPRN